MYCIPASHETHLQRDGMGRQARARTLPCFMSNLKMVFVTRNSYQHIPLSEANWLRECVGDDVYKPQ
jgi:hypothetical protein